MHGICPSSTSTVKSKSKRKQGNRHCRSPIQMLHPLKLSIGHCSMGGDICLSQPTSTIDTFKCVKMSSHTKSTTRLDWAFNFPKHHHILTIAGWSRPDGHTRVTMTQRHSVRAVCYYRRFKPVGPRSTFSNCSSHLLLQAPLLRIFP